jgi:AAA domain, putative AbiEii toxin, Type IV TA system
MRLKSFSYVEFEGEPQEWRLEELTFGDRMLIVGKNAAGKSRSIRVAAALAKNLVGAAPPAVSGNFSATFNHEGSEYIYEMKCQDSSVTHERICVNGKDFLTRGLGGLGTIRAEKISNGLDIDFQVPTSVLAAVAKRDSIQHSFIEPLFQWADSLRYYQFGAMLQGSMVVFVPGGPRVDDRDENAVVAIFNEGRKLFGQPFVDSVINDMCSIDYDIELIDIAPPHSIRFLTNGPQPKTLSVKERSLQGTTDLIGMSTGMFRVLALLIHVNFARFKGSASSVLIDDIGEGLDYERSTKLIELLRNRSIQHNFQLVMTTNDKFVMNHVPLEEWTVLHRSGNTVHVNNQENSKAAFDEFKFTGLSNFSFFEMNSNKLQFDGVSEGENA